MFRDVRPVDGGPACDVAGRDVVSVAAMAALDATKRRLGATVSLAGVPAARALAGGVARVDVGVDGHAGELSFIDDQLLELPERPRVQCAALRPSSPDPPADAFEVLEGDPAAGAFGPAHKLLRDRVVDVGGEPALTSRTLSQPAAGGARALRLQPAADATVTATQTVQRPPAARLPSESVAMFTTPRSTPSQPSGS